MNHNSFPGGEQTPAYQDDGDAAEFPSFEEHIKSMDTENLTRIDNKIGRDIAKNLNTEKIKFDRSLEQTSKSPDYRKDKDGNVYFGKIGDTIVFGETKHTRRVDDFPHETNEEDYDNSVVGIRTDDGNQYYISQGVFLDRGNDKKVDLLKRRQDDPHYRFPNITIGEPLPYNSIARNIPEGTNIGIVTEVVCLGEAPSTSPNENKTKKDIQEYIANEIKQSETAKRIRHIQH